MVCFIILINRKKIDFFFVTSLALNPFPNKPMFYFSSVQVFRRHCGEKEKLLVMSNFSFSCRFFFNQFEKNFLPFSSNLKLSSANSFSLGESKIFHFGKHEPHGKILDSPKLKAFSDDKIFNYMWIKLHVFDMILIGNDTIIVDKQM